MFIAHLPAGYLLTSKLQNKLNTDKFLKAGILGSIAPDLDMFYFYLIDNSQHLHHSYWTHIPFFWFVIASISYLLILSTKKKSLLIPTTFFFANIFLHLFLDTVVGKIHWLYPLSNANIYFFEVPAIYDNWILNFVLHWTFIIEILLIIQAIITFNKKRALQSNLENINISQSNT